MFLWLAVDITKDERAKEKLQTLKIETVEMAQQVIAKQMTVAQEIASFYFYSIIKFWLFRKLAFIR